MRESGFPALEARDLNKADAGLWAPKFSERLLTVVDNNAEGGGRVHWMGKTIQKEEAERQRPEGRNCLGLSKEMQKPKMWDVAFGGKVNTGEKSGGSDTKRSAA